LFHKFIANKLNLIDAYPLLRMVDRQKLLASGQVEYSANGDLVAVKTAVSSAQRVLLLVHGIIGDTIGLTQGMAPKHLGLEDVPAVAERYDLILTLDYECIASGIERNANELKNRLTEVGLGAGHKKTLDLVAHSMGGLISRTFIKRPGGAAQVRHLVMLGTPNAGSPWPTVIPWVQHTITSLAVLGLNALRTVAWPAHVLSATIGWLGQQKLQNLEEMRPDSTVLAALFAAEDPHVPNTVICGDITLDPGRRATFTRLRDQFASGKVFLDQPNDLATTVARASHIPNRHPETTFVPAIACDHLNYFASREALHALAQSLEV
jgi:pimeloyl-ACP methyl ester carboxylesterase